MTGIMTTQTVLSAMITPAVLIAACGSLTISTSARLGRVIDRARKVSQHLLDHSQSEHASVLGGGELHSQLVWAGRRARLLQRSLQGLYLALSSFMATSVSVGVVVLLGQRFSAAPIALGLLGAGLLFYSSLLLILESRLAIHALEAETRGTLDHLRKGENALENRSSGGRD